MTHEELKKLQSHILDMMKKVDKLLKANGIFYIMLGGTVLGAIRHKGFIPWDDDIDIGILRKDIERAEELLSQMKEYQYEFIEKHIIADEPCGHLHYVKDGYTIETSPTIDFFAIDAVPDENDKKRTSLFMLYANIHHAAVYRHAPKNRGLLKKILVGTILCILPNALLDKLQTWSLQKLLDFDTRGANWLGNVFQGQKEFFPAKVYLETIDAVFEDASFPIPKYYDDYLTKLYGDYMTLPPENERMPKHR